MLRSLISVNPSKVSPLLISARKGHWNKEWKAGPYPKTEAERIAAAKKYGMLPEEYEPYDDDGFGFGDYPKLPFISKNNVDHWYPYTCPEQRRNWGEPVHILETMLQEDRAEIPYTSPVTAGGLISFRYMFACFFAYCFGVSGLAYLMTEYDVISFHPRLEWPYPEEGKKHYKWEKF